MWKRTTQTSLAATATSRYKSVKKLKTAHNTRNMTCKRWPLCVCSKSTGNDMKTAAGQWSRTSFFPFLTKYKKKMKHFIFLFLSVSARIKRQLGNNQVKRAQTAKCIHLCSDPEWNTKVPQGFLDMWCLIRDKHRKMQQHGDPLFFSRILFVIFRAEKRTGNVLGRRPISTIFRLRPCNGGPD